MDFKHHSHPAPVICPDSIRNHTLRRTLCLSMALQPTGTTVTSANRRDEYQSIQRDISSKQVFDLSWKHSEFDWLEMIKSFEASENKHWTLESLKLFVIHLGLLLYFHFLSYVNNLIWSITWGRNIRLACCGSLLLIRTAEDLNAFFCFVF